MGGDQLAVKFIYIKLGISKQSQPNFDPTKPIRPARGQPSLFTIGVLNSELLTQAADASVVF